MLAVLLATTSLSLAPTFELFEPHTQAHGVSKNGKIVCGSYWTGECWVVAMWEGNAMTSSFATDSKTDVEKAVSISDQGNAAVLVERKGSAGFSVFKGYRWTKGGRPTALQSIGGSNESWPRAVSRDGSVIAGSLFGTKSDFPVTWKPDGSVTKLAPPSGATTPGGEALNLSSDGSVVVGHLKIGKDLLASIWKGGKVTLLGDLVKKDRNSYAWACNRDGSVVAGFGNEGKRLVPMIWTQKDGMKKLGDMPSQFKSGMARGMSDDGKTVVGLWGNAKDGSGFIWTETSGVATAVDFLKQKGLGSKLNGLTIQAVLGVSADGRTIVGTCTDKEKQLRGYKATF